MIERWIVALSLVLTFCAPSIAQGPSMPPKGNPDHVHPAEGLYCEHGSSDPSRECDCHRVHQDDLCEDEPRDPMCRADCFENAHFVENPNGKSIHPQTGVRGDWFGSHCRCPVHCRVTK